MVLRVISGTQISEYEFQKGETVLGILQRNKRRIESPCGGNGTCGKCRVRIEGQDAWTAACRLLPEDSLAIELPEPQGGFSVVPESKRADEISDFDGYGIAVDIGTTTIAMQLAGHPDGRAYRTETMLNGQRIYGADVISRIRAANEGKSNELCRLARTCLTDGIQRLLAGCHVKPEEIGRIVIAGNTTMTHLLLGYPCNTLGRYPFTPYSLEAESWRAEELFAVDGLSCETLVFPGISAFVGGDIAAGLFAEEFAAKEKVSVFLDLGTNGEMAVGNGRRLIVTSTAAGPAFEGGKITWGTGSVEGAVCGFSLSGGKKVETIGGKRPCGICGSGVVEIMAELLEHGIVDETGLLSDEYFDEGYPVAETDGGETIVFTQKDIRELQMAKAAVRAGLEILAAKWGTVLQSVDEIVIAGGFGFHLNLEKACRIGLLPPECIGKMYAAGNTSLAGAKKALLAGGIGEEVDSIIGIAEEVNLAQEENFQEIYMNQMYF